MKWRRKTSPHISLIVVGKGEKTFWKGACGREGSHIRQARGLESVHNKFSRKHMVLDLLQSPMNGILVSDQKPPTSIRVARSRARWAVCRL